MTALSLHAWLDHMWPAVVIAAAILSAWAALSIPFALIAARLLRRCDHDHAADHADLAAKVVGL